MTGDDASSSMEPQMKSARMAWGHPIRHLEMHAGYWAESVLVQKPFAYEAVARLLVELDEALLGFSEPDTGAVGWTAATEPNATIVAGLERLVAVMRELERIYAREPGNSDL